MSDNVVYTEEDQKPQIEEECKPHCVKQWQEYKACVEPSKGTPRGKLTAQGSTLISGTAWTIAPPPKSSQG
eukprot:CAMPEP_0202405614 /NCGR_PEP_ID=MMETSP1128-20130828/7229_1 /ASSEMBLY_ACC=CAM_ASM_000463 /TAXON_ID=3047 /ORGANISM="Dunaliella tertiolecta, Strain CCMP1320" /LENGTH=70 /DNA_ID=CAMNT_0049010309 /DNA_START=40 /DNA_END=253 /DNA_ORIENTATION=+